MTSERQVYLGLGSNIGDRYSHLADAISRLEEKGLTVEPEPLLDLLKSVEAEMGRESGRPRHSPRVIDVDLLLMEDLEYESERLRLPHRETTSRRFVLAPLLEIDPDLTLPDGTRLANAMAELEKSPEGQDIRRAGSVSRL